MRLRLGENFPPDLDVLVGVAVGLARISHKFSTAAADPGLGTALRSVGLLDVLFKYACGALGRDALSPGPSPPPRHENL